MRGRLRSLRRRAKYFYPALLGILPILDSYASVQFRISFSDLVAPILVVVAIVTLIYVLSRRLLPNSEAALAMAAVGALILFQPKLIRQITDLLPLIGGKVALALVITALVALTVLIIKKIDTKQLAMLNTAAAVLAVGAVAYYGLVLAAGSTSYARVTAARFVDIGAISQAIDAPARPNIYQILLDGYGRADVLRQLYDFDNTPFLDSLRQEEFAVAEQSVANYSQTMLSLSSMLNWNYLEALNDPDVNTEDVNDLIQLQRYNRSVELLRELGYTWAWLPAEFWGTHLEGAADRTYRYPRLRPHHRHVIDQSLLGLFVSFRYTDLDHLNITEYALENLLTPAREIDGPVFTLAHLISPHPPFIYDQHGPTVSGVDTSIDDGFRLANYRADYIGQLQYLNQRILEKVEQIRAEDPEAVIILHSDHGPASTLDWQNEEPSDETLFERMPNLLAIYMPETYRQDFVFYDAISPVNVFRSVFNAVFGTDFELLEDEAYFSAHPRPFHYTQAARELIRPGASE
jgi:hypothetical protein